MDATKLQQIEARANAIHAEMTHTRTRCDDCGMISPPTDDRGCHDECPNAGGNARLWHAMVTRDGTKLEGVAGLCEIAGHMTALVAEVRRLTAALATVTTERDAALDAARREGAEAMREAAVRLLDACGGPQSKLAIEDAIHAVNHAALPLDAPGGAS